MLSLQYSGHPLFDVGLAAITAHAQKRSPVDLTNTDLEAVAGFIENYYTQQPLTSFLTVSLMNSDFTQPAYKDDEKRRRDYAKLVSRSLDPELHQSSEVCVFTGQPALSIPLSLKRGKDELQPGRAYRQHIPLITGEGVINFSPWGDPGLPISGVALLCLQFFPMGCLKCSGRLLAVHSTNPKITLAFAKEALKRNQIAISQAKVSGQSKMTDTSSSARTSVIDTFLRVDDYQQDLRTVRQHFSVTAYHLTNSGQSSPLDEQSPPLKIYHLPLEMVNFLATLKGPDYREAWGKLVWRAWEKPKLSKKSSSPDVQVDDDTATNERGRNYLYEDLFRLPAYAHGFLRRYLLRIPNRNASLVDPRRGYDIRQELSFISWQITELLLRKVVNMNTQRIEEIRKLGDTLATYIQEQEDDAFFRNFFRMRSPGRFRELLVKANYKHVKAGHDPLLEFDPYLTVFEEGKEVMRTDWSFVRDLILIRMIERLHANQYFSKHPSALPDDADIAITLSDSEQ